MSSPLETRQDLRPVSGEFVPTWFEFLENRRLLSATSGIVMEPALSLSPLASATASIRGYTPQQIAKAYGFDSISLDNGHGGTVKGDGSGQTIAIVDAYNDPDILSDLKAFDKQFSLSDPSFTQVSQTGSTTNLPKNDAGWAEEISLDVEWAHVVAPKAKIMLVEAKSASLNDLLSAVDYARGATGVSVVSMSWGTDEFASELNLDSHFTTPGGHQGVTFVASSGDQGSWMGPTWPSVSPNVLAVGGTTLTLNSNGTIANETGWSDSGGGSSFFEPEPSYQAQYGGTLQSRGAPDVSIDANPNTGYAVFDSYGTGGHNWMEIGGTSAGAPQWAALVSIADQGRVLKGAGTLDGLTGTLPALYSLYNSTDYAQNFNDVVQGRSSWFVGAQPGWDEMTGLGTPKGPTLIGSLVNFGLQQSNPSLSIGGKSSTASSSAKKTTTHPDFETPAPVQTAVALPAAQPAGSLFSSTPVNSSVEAAVASAGTRTTFVGQGSGTGEFGVGAEGTGLSTNGRGTSQRSGLSTNAQSSGEDVSTMLSRAISESDASPMRHLLGRAENDSTVSSKAGRMYAPSTYDAASFAATRDSSDDALTWQQLTALIGTGVLIGTYAIEANRRKRMLTSMDLDFEK